MAQNNSGLGATLERVSSAVTVWTGSTAAVLSATAITLAWLVVGPIFHYSDTWQLTINTGTTVVTFLMVFLIQRAQNKHALALQLKLNELVAVMEGASNRLIDVEDLSERDLALLHAHYRRLAEMAKMEGDIGSSHSIEEAEQRHSFKSKGRRPLPPTGER